VCTGKKRVTHEEVGRLLIQVAGIHLRRNVVPFRSVAREPLQEVSGKQNVLERRLAHQDKL